MIIIKYALFVVLCLISILSQAAPPTAADVFQLSVKPIDPNTFSIEWQIKPGFFLYQDRIRIEENADSNGHVGHMTFPKPLIQKDSQGKSYGVYRNQLNIRIPVLGEAAGESILHVDYQGCSDDGFCYPPQSQAIKLAFNDHLALKDVTLEPTAELPLPREIPLTDHERFDQLFSSHNWLLILCSFFSFGLLLAFTPCVLPMVPVLSGIIVGHGPNLSTRKAFFLSLSYVLSMSITYALVGAVVALLGSNLQVMMQSSWAIGLFSGIFVALSLSMFGFYELRLPTAWQASLANASRGYNHSHYLSAAIMGCLSTLILSPCVTAPLIGALGYIAQSGDILLGSLSLFFLGLGMGTPLLLIGTSAGKLLPKAGPWMNGVKAFFGVLLLAVAIYLLSRLLPALITMSLWASLLIFSGIFMGALTKAKSQLDKFTQGLGIILLVYGLLILVGASQGHQDPLLPLVSSNTIDQTPEARTSITVKNIKQLQDALTNAQGKRVLLDFYADWCASCKDIERTTFKDKQVLAALNNFLIIKVDLSPNNRDSNALLSRYHVIAPPTFVFLDKDGIEIDPLRLVGEVSTSIFYAHLNQAIGQSPL
jgi:thiol:disulfide interchange protein DsbD